MSFPKPEYSRSKVNWAGEIISSAKPEHDDLLLALKILNNWRAAHNYPVNTFNVTLRERVKKIDPKAIVAQRLKRAPAIIEKLQRFSKMRLSRMQDIGGLRAITASSENVEKLVGLYNTAGFLEHDLVRLDDYVKSPKDDGYRSVHLVYKYKSKKVLEYDGLQIELQIRSKLQHAWATAVETMSTVLGKNIKARRGDKEWNSFFAVSSSAFAYLERRPLVPGYDTLSREQTFIEVRKASEEIKALERMRDYSKAIEWIDRQEKKWSYHLIVLRSTERKIAVTSYARDDFKQATSDYADAEVRAGQGEPIEPVLVSVGPLKTLKKAYPNFFLDINDFMRIIEQIIAQSKR
ncbi:MAG: RelA/SpoT domain-containing protein [Candidatus Sungbacteria bacterium]|nr:RelA/SpoT domain-containing protein [Candidatus Sungbacteria bacterium]